MNNPNSNFYLPNQPEYDKEFWNYIRGKKTSEAYLESGRRTTGGYILPSVSDSQFTEALKKAFSTTSVPMCTPMRELPRFSANTPTLRHLGFRMAVKFRHMTVCWTLRNSHWKTINWLPS